MAMDNFFVFFNMFKIMFFLAFFLIIGGILFSIFRGAKQWNKNNHSPRLTVPAMVVTKRTQVGHHHHGDASGVHNSHSSSYTDYYATFQVESGDRMELHIDGSEFGMLVEGDHGRLTFQGTRYLGFERM